MRSGRRRGASNNELGPDMAIVAAAKASADAANAAIRGGDGATAPSLGRNRWRYFGGSGEGP